jgi:hypothetical protein
VFTDSGQTLGTAKTWAVVLTDVDGDAGYGVLFGNYNRSSNVWANSWRFACLGRPVLAAHLAHSALGRIRTCAHGSGTRCSIP